MRLLLILVLLTTPVYASNDFLSAFETAEVKELSCYIIQTKSKGIVGQKDFLEDTRYVYCIEPEESIKTKEYREYIINRFIMDFIF